MALQDYCNILLFLVFSLHFSVAQETEVRCINPAFDQLVDDYLEFTIPAISVADAFEVKEEYVFLDARENKEYTTSHIANAIHIGYDDFNIKSLQSKVSKESKIIVYCSIGYRSEKIGEILKKNGYKNVQNLYGSIFEWVNQHYPVYDQNGNQTNALHTYSKKWSKWVEDEDVEKVW